MWVRKLSKCVNVVSSGQFHHFTRGWVHVRTSVRHFLISQLLTRNSYLRFCLRSAVTFLHWPWRKKSYYITSMAEEEWKQSAGFWLLLELRYDKISAVLLNMKYSKCINPHWVTVCIFCMIALTVRRGYPDRKEAIWETSFRYVGCKISPEMFENVLLRSIPLVPPAGHLINKRENVNAFVLSLIEVWITRRFK